MNFKKKYKCDSQKAQECISNLKEAVTIEDQRKQIQMICGNIFKIDNYFDRVYDNLKFYKQWNSEHWEKNYKLQEQLDEKQREIKHMSEDKDSLLYWINKLFYALEGDKKKDKKTEALIKRLKSEIKDYVDEDTYYEHCFWNDDKDKDKEYKNHVIWK